MLDDEQSWLEITKNVKPISSKKAIVSANHKIDFKKKRSDHLPNSFFMLKSGSDFLPISHNVKANKDIINDKLDLHGFSVEDAYEKLLSFITKNYNQDNRHLLIITGYGDPIKKTGVIKNNLHGWLDSYLVRHMILSCTQAESKHGGHGAFYILLRKKRSK